MYCIFLVHTVVNVFIVFALVSDVWLICFIVPMNQGKSVTFLSHAFCNITQVSRTNIFFSKWLRRVERRQIIGPVADVFLRLILTNSSNVIRIKAKISDKFRVTDGYQFVVTHRIRLLGQEKFFYHQCLFCLVKHTNRRIYNFKPRIVQYLIYTRPLFRIFDK